MAYEQWHPDISMRTGSTSFLANRMVRVSASETVVHTTGPSTGATGVRPFGVALNAPTASTSSTGSAVAVRTFGIVQVEASSAAITAGSLLRCTSGAVASTSRLGGTVKMTTALALGVYSVGIALTSAAAGTGRRLISAFIAPIGRA